MFQMLQSSAGEELYVAMDKGAISSTHVLLLPIEHVSSTLELSTAGYAELEKYCGALRQCFKSQVRCPSLQASPFPDPSQHRSSFACLCRNLVMHAVYFLEGK